MILSLIFLYSSMAFSALPVTGSVEYLETETVANYQSLQVQIIGQPNICDGANYPEAAYLSNSAHNFNQIHNILQAALVSGKSVSFWASADPLQGNRCIMTRVRINAI